MGEPIYHQQDYGTLPIGFENPRSRRSRLLNEWSAGKVILLIVWLCAFTAILGSVMKAFFE
jgi:hypothetical protein